MSTKAGILSAIKAKVGTTQLGIWRIGLTHDLADRKKYWAETENQSTTYWSAWEADSLSDAQEIEADYIESGMKGGTGGNLSAYKTVFVYVF